SHDTESDTILGLESGVGRPSRALRQMSCQISRCLASAICCNDNWYSRTIWQSRRRDQLQREPLCQPCLRKSIVRLATEVHHLVEHEGDWNLFVTAPLESPL